MPASICKQHTWLFWGLTRFGYTSNGHINNARKFYFLPLHILGLSSSNDKFFALGKISYWQHWKSQLVGQQRKYSYTNTQLNHHQSQIGRWCKCKRQPVRKARREKIRKSLQPVLAKLVSPGAEVAAQGSAAASPAAAARVSGAAPGVTATPLTS